MVLHIQRKTSVQSAHFITKQHLQMPNLFTELTVLCYRLQAMQKSNVLYRLILIILHCLFTEITLTHFVFSLSKQACLSLSHQQRSSHKCPCGIFINQTTNLKWIFKALFIPHHSSYINLNALCV